jgi:peptidase E
MKIILASSGLANEEIIGALEEMVGKPREEINVAIINEAIKGEQGDMRWFAEELQRITEVIGGNIEFIDLQAHDLDYVERRIDVADMIFCFGGNTDYLANIFIKTGFDKLLPKILAEKVWVGSSAGSCVLCHKESEEIQKTVFREKREAEHYMDIVPIIFLPHLHGFFKFDQEEVLRASELTDLLVYAVSDDCALKVVDGEVAAVLGTDYIVAEGGE